MLNENALMPHFFKSYWSLWLFWKAGFIYIHVYCFGWVWARVNMG